MPKTYKSHDFRPCRHISHLILPISRWEFQTHRGFSDTNHQSPSLILLRSLLLTGEDPKKQIQMMILSHQCWFSEPLSIWNDPLWLSSRKLVVREQASAFKQIWIHTLPFPPLIPAHNFLIVSEKSPKRGPKKREKNRSVGTYLLMLVAHASFSTCQQLSRKANINI